MGPVQAVGGEHPSWVPKLDNDLYLRVHREAAVSCPDVSEVQNPRRSVQVGALQHPATKLEALGAAGDGYIHKPCRRTCHTTA